MKRHSRGFNLIELMIAITLLALLLGFGVPTFRQFTRNNAVTVAHNDLVTSLNLARSEALRRNRPVSICASADGEDCGPESAWAEGWMAFTDRNTAGTVDGDDEVLQVWQAATGQLMFDANTSTFVQFLPTGMTGTSSTIDIWWDGCMGQRGRRVNVIATGAVTSEKIDCP